MERINYHQLYYFYVIATEGSIKAACEKLHVTQPTVSGQLKELEESLGCKLFRREHRKLVINAEGLKALEKAEKIFSMGDELVNTLHLKKGSPRENIRIGVSEAITNHTLHAFTLEAWKDKTLAIDVIHDDLPYLVDLMNQDELDIIISDSSFNKYSDRYKSINIGTQKIHIVGCDKFKKLKRDFPASMDGQPFLNYSQSSMMRRDLDYFFKLQGIQPDVIGKVDDLLLATLVAAKGHCLAALPERVAKPELKKRGLFVIGEIPGLTLTEWVIVSKLSQRKLAVRKVIKNFLN